MREGSRSGTGGSPASFAAAEAAREKSKAAGRPRGRRLPVDWKQYTRKLCQTCFNSAKLRRILHIRRDFCGKFRSARPAARRRKQPVYLYCRFSGAKCYTKIQKNLRPYPFRGKSAEVWLNFQILTTNPKSRIMTTRSCASGSFPPKTCQAAGPQNKERDKS